MLASLPHDDFYFRGRKLYLTSQDVHSGKAKKVESSLTGSARLTYSHLCAMSPLARLLGF